MKGKPRAAENGTIFITDTDPHPFAGSRAASVIRILEPTVIASISGVDCVGVDYYEGKSLDVDSKDILAQVTALQLTSGAVQVVFA